MRGMIAIGLSLLVGLAAAPAQAVTLDDFDSTPIDGVVDTVSGAPSFQITTIGAGLCSLFFGGLAGA
ncbi:MAG: hypothetical protein AAGF76_17565, partial [Pseudomonadota bacterium]